MRSRTKKGFTLAELLIVVAVIAVLAAIAYPIFSARLHTARLAVDTAHQRDLEAYAGVLDNSGSLVVGGVTILKAAVDDTAYCFLKDGTLSPDVWDTFPATIPVDAYLAQADGNGHKKGDALVLIVYVRDGYQSTIRWISGTGAL